MEGKRTPLETSLRQPGRRQRRHALLAVGALAVLLLAVLYLGIRALTLFEQPWSWLEEKADPPTPLETWREILGEIRWPSPRRNPNGLYEQRVDGHRVLYTLEPGLQEEALSVFRQYKVPYGAFVALEPATGRILALADYARDGPDLPDFCGRATYPAASLIKIVTAVAALESGKVSPSTEIRYEGNPYRLYRRKISPHNGRRENHTSTLSEALGKSNNVAFAKVGVNVVGVDSLDAALASFGFNRGIPFDFRLQESRATVPRERYPLARTAAGFGDVYVSPVHACLIAATIANQGVMMQPYVVDSIHDAGGKLLYRAAPAAMGRATSGEVAQQVARMMVDTVTLGTSSKVFYRYARKLRREIGVAGKTGSLTGTNPPGKYEWFIGFAPVENPKIAVASLVVNHELWHIKGSYVAQAVMKEFFGM